MKCTISLSVPFVWGGERTEHETQKPLKVCIPFIEISSNPGDLVLDPFMGSGTTAIAALNRDRQFIGFEIEDKYCKIIQQRFHDFLENNALFFDGVEPRIIEINE